MQISTLGAVEFVPIGSSILAGRMKKLKGVLLCAIQ